MADVPTFDTALFRDALTEGDQFTEPQARVLTRALTGATVHLPSRDGLDQFKAEMKTTLAERLNEQTWRVVQIVAGALVLNVAAIVGTGLALYNALKS